LNKLIFKTRRAVSETIGTMLLLAITVAGAVIISTFVSDGFFSGVNQNPSGVEASSDSIQLTGYDTRDSTKLINVQDLNNYFNGVPILCAEGNDDDCTVTIADDIPIDDGTEFIALQLRNMNTNSVILQNIQVNNVLHAWDAGTAGILFEATSSLDAGTKYPRSGFFSIIPSPDRPIPEKQFSSQEVKGNEEVRIIIKLSENLSDIKMGKSMQIVVNFGASQPANFIVSSGDAKW
jgi:flagellin-like protein